MWNHNSKTLIVFSAYSSSSVDEFSSFTIDKSPISVMGNFPSSWCSSKMKLRKFQWITCVISVFALESNYFFCSGLTTCFNLLLFAFLKNMNLNIKKVDSEINYQFCWDFHPKRLIFLSITLPFQLVTISPLQHV